MFRSGLLALALSLCALSASAGTSLPSSAMAAYRAGAYDKAATLSEDEGSATSYAFAAQSLIADAISRKDGFCVPCLEKAERLAEHAISLDPRVIDGYLQDAVAVGFRGRSIGVSAARTERLAEKARTLLDRAMAIDATNVWARASLGAWHLEIVHHAGRILASLMYDASKDEGLNLYRAALRDAPDIAVLHYHYALSILALDPQEYREEAENELKLTLAIKADDALSAYVRAKSAAVLDALQSASAPEIETLVSTLQGYPPS